jgi:hypothetical protein
MPAIRDSAPFEFPAHLQKWWPAGAVSHFDFHLERCKAAPDRLKLNEIQRMTDCDMCPNKGRGGPVRAAVPVCLLRKTLPRRRTTMNPSEAPEDLMPNPLADYKVKFVPRLMAQQMAPMAGDYVLVWRAAACLCAQNWAGCDQVLAETGLDGRAFDLFKIAVHEAAKIALLAAEDDPQLAEEHFTRLIQAQQLIEAGQ